MLKAVIRPTYYGTKAFPLAPWKKRALGVERQGTRVGLKINTVNIKDLSLTGRSIFPIGTNGQNIEGVNQFVYLGNVVCADGRIDFDFIPRSNSVRSTFIVLSKIWKSRYFNRNIKLRFFRVNVLSWGST